MPFYNVKMLQKSKKVKIFGSVEKERPSIIASFDYKGLQGQFG